MTNGQTARARWSLVAAYMYVVTDAVKRCLL